MGIFGTKLTIISRAYHRIKPFFRPGSQPGRPLVDLSRLEPSNRPLGTLGHPATVLSKRCPDCFVDCVLWFIYLQIEKMILGYLLTVFLESHFVSGVRFASYPMTFWYDICYIWEAIATILAYRNNPAAKGWSSSPNKVFVE